MVVVGVVVRERRKGGEGEGVAVVWCVLLSLLLHLVRLAAVQQPSQGLRRKSREDLSKFVDGYGGGGGGGGGGVGGGGGDGKGRLERGGHEMRRGLFN